MTIHYILKCATCKVVIQQCRCIEPNKSVRYGLCDECAKKATNEHYGSA